MEQKRGVPWGNLRILDKKTEVFQKWKGEFLQKQKDSSITQLEKKLGRLVSAVRSESGWRQVSDSTWSGEGLSFTERANLH